MATELATGLQSLSFSSSVSTSRGLRAQPCLTSAPRSQSLQIQSRVAIRFQRYGRRKSPFYRIVAIDSRRQRDGIPCDFLGWYNPLNKETNLNAPLIKKWLANGAQPSEAAARLLKKAMVIDTDVED